jgi:hypothetical protein
MKMRGFLAALTMAATATVAASADNADKTLANQKGSVSFQLASGAPKPVAPNGVVALKDKDYAITGASSLAAVGLPDSSRVLVGSESKIQLGFFSQAEGATAKFIVYNGKIRFVVQHPAGAHANYTFQTSTGTIAVRGTEGDISSDGKTLQVNVYEVCDPSTPVTVTTKDGKSTDVLPGQSFLAQIVNGVVQEQVSQLTQQAIDQFSPDFGVPTSWDAAKGQIVGYASNAAAGAANQATGGIGGGIVGDQVGNAIGGLFKKKSTPTPSPTPKSDTCSHA